ncbi:glycosyltransferase family 4 protein [Paenibacillus sp. FSL R5-0914]|uniref:glycosyltransferase family 4 protein n=1 Tax=Paenibacillus sp. FSL R5-0914 TaxID=2921665 RepID=UPI0030F91A64
MNKIAFVIPWYAIDIPGGSEAACRNIAERLAAKGVKVEILTTCVKQFSSDWNENFYKPGMELINGVVVRRFKVKKRNTQKFDEVNYKLMNDISITIEEEETFLENMVNSLELEKYLEDNKELYSGFIFIPYMFGTTYFGAQRVLEKAVLIPAFHDESYAYFENFRKVYSKVKGFSFFSSAEAEWANKQFPIENIKQRVLGLGISRFESSPKRFKEKYNIKNPFILYAGRKDHGKNVHILLNYFSKFRNEKKFEVDLILIGGGQIDIPEDIKSNVIDLGFIPEQDKYDAYGASELLCNPSPNESFSIVIMESWYSGRPILVFEECAVTKNFCIESNGGLYYGNYREFEACLELMLSNPDLSNKMGNNGKLYVQKNFDWDFVIDEYIDFLKTCFQEQE